MEYLTTLYRDTSTCGISQASSDSPGKSGWALNTAWFLQHLNAKIIIIPMQWDTTILIWKVPVRITTSLSQGVFTYQLHTSTVCTDPTCIITEALFPAHPLLFVLYCSLQLKSGLDDFKSSSFFYAFKTLMLYRSKCLLEVWSTFSLTPSSAVFQVAGEVLISHSLSFQHQLHFLFFIFLVLPWDMQLVS